MQRIYRRLAGLVVAGLAIFAVTGAVPATGVAPEDDALHLRLIRAIPSPDSTVAAPEKIRLWFTEEPQEGATSIRLVDAAGDLVETEDAEADADDATIFHTVLTSPPAPGVYQVVWRTMAADGHVVSGDYHFSIRAQ